MHHINMKKHIFRFTLIQMLAAMIISNAFCQQPIKTIPPSFATRIPPGPWCLILINNKHYSIKCRLVDSLIKPKTIKSLKIESDNPATAIYGYRAANGLVLIEIRRRFWRRDFPRLQPFLQNL